MDNNIVEKSKKDYINFDEIKVDYIEIFGFKVIKCKIPKHFYDKESLKKDIDSMFDLKIVKKCDATIEQIGKQESTVKLNKKYITTLNDVTPLINYISAIILKTFYGSSSNERKIIYPRMWMNKMYENCTLKCHKHSHDAVTIDGTAIFYYSVPKNSSKLIILKDDIEGEVKKCHDKISHYIQVETGDLIIHEKNVPHAASKHMSGTPRMCFVFDFLSKNNKTLKFNYI